MAALAESDWTSFDQDRFDLEKGLECLNTNLTSAIDHLAPLKIVRPVKGHDPWLDGGMISLRCKRDSALKRYLHARTNNPLFEMSTSLKLSAMTLMRAPCLLGTPSCKPRFCTH